MKKLILIAILFVSISLAFTQDISSRSDSPDRKTAELTAENDFRRKIILKLGEYFEKQLKEYYDIWEETDQNYNRQLVNELVKIGVKKTTFEDNNYFTIINMTQAEFEKNFPASPIPKTSNIVELIHCIDKELIKPNKNTYNLLVNFVELLAQIIIEYPEKVLIYKEKEVDIILNTPTNLGSVINFSINNQQFQETSGVENYVRFKYNTSQLKKANPTLIFKLDIEKTFRTQRLIHKQFFEALIKKHLVNNSGQINILLVGDSKFIYKTNNFEIGRNDVIKKLNQKGWEVGTGNSYTHIIVINKEIVEEKLLNIGAYYLKARLVVSIYDKQNDLVQSSFSKTVESMDSDSIENCHNKIDELLLKEINF